jgi:hypothetical protein
MKRKKLLEWLDKNKIKIAQGDRLFFGYQKVNKHYLLMIESSNGLATRLICKTEKDCLTISNILNKV